MKAQSLRRTLWFVDALLVAALLATGAWYVLKVRPAAAGGPKEWAWADAALRKYKEERIVPEQIHPVSSEKELDAIVRRDLRDTATRDRTTIVGVFVGPPPPEPKPPEQAKVEEGPKDLKATGNLLMVFYRKAPEPASILWTFNDPKAPHLAFRVGQFIKSGKNEPDRFKLTAVEPNPDAPKWRLLFDVYDDPKKDPVRKDQSAEFDLTPKPSGKTSPIHPPTRFGAPPAPSPNAPPGARPGDPSAPVALTGQSVWIGRLGNNVRVELERDAYDALWGGNAEALMDAVKTQVATDEKGNPKGLRISGVTEKSLAAQFDVQPGDILLSINGQVVHSRADAVKIVTGLPRDTQSVKVVIERNGRQIFYDIDPRDPKVRGAANRLKYGK